MSDDDRVRGGDLPDWDGVDRVPLPVVPVPAAGTPDLRGRRVLVGAPGLGWRGDLRADTPVVTGSRTYVPVLAEHEWYRAEVEQTETFAPLVPVERVWVETVGGAPGGQPRRSPTDLVSRLVSLDAPGVRAPVPAREVAGLTGRRVVAVPGPGDRTGAERRDLRAVTEPYSGGDGDICVRVVPELEWYRWAWQGRLPKSAPIPVHLLWVE